MRVLWVTEDIEVTYMMEIMCGNDMIEVMDVLAVMEVMSEGSVWSVESVSVHGREGIENRWQWRMIEVLDG